MTLEDFKLVLDQVDVPIAYDHFHVGQSPAPPFIVYQEKEDVSFYADGEPYYSIKKINVELCTDEKEPALEAKLQTALKGAGICYKKYEGYLESEKMYESLYECEV